MLSAQPQATQGERTPTTVGDSSLLLLHSGKLGTELLQCGWARRSGWYNTVRAQCWPDDSRALARGALIRAGHNARRLATRADPAARGRIGARAMKPYPPAGYAPPTHTRELRPALVIRNLCNRWMILDEPGRRSRCKRTTTCSSLRPRSLRLCHPIAIRATSNTTAPGSGMQPTGAARRQSCCMAAWVIAAIGAIKFQRCSRVATAPL